MSDRSPPPKEHAVTESVGRAETDLQGDRAVAGLGEDGSVHRRHAGKGRGHSVLPRALQRINKPGPKLPLVFVTAISAKHRMYKRLEFQLAKLGLIKVNLNSQGRWKKRAGQRKIEGHEDSPLSQLRNWEPKGLLVAVFPGNSHSI